MLLAVLPAVPAAAGSYGGREKQLQGATLLINVTIGEWEDHEAEAKALREGLAEADKTLAKLEKPVRSMLAHFRKGGHRYGASRSLLAGKKTQDEVSLEVALEGGAAELYLYATKELTEPKASLLAAHFVAAQLDGGGLPKRPPPAHETPADLQDRLWALSRLQAAVPHHGLMALLGYAREQEGLLREVAALLEPAPMEEPEWAHGSMRPAGHGAAKVLVALLDDKPWPIEVLSAKQLDADGFAGLVRLMALTTPPARQQQEWARLREAAKQREDAKEVAAWLSEL